MNKTSYFSLLCKRNIAIMVLSNMAIGLMDGPMRWLLPLLLMEKGGPFLVGLSFSIANLGDTVIALLGGQFSDRFGRKIMYLILHTATVSVTLLRALSGVVVFSLRLSLLRD